MFTASFVDSIVSLVVVFNSSKVFFASSEIFTFSPSSFEGSFSSIFLVKSAGSSLMIKSPVFTRRGKVIEVETFSSKRFLNDSIW
ncbi:MAG: hypothetical protein ACNI3H_05010 [Halarcobacter ebronensis]